MADRLIPLTVTTPTHGLAITIYWSQGLLGILYVTGVAQAMAMTQIAGERATGVWGMLLALAGVTCAMAAHSASQARNPAGWLRVELWAAVLLGALSALYEVTLVIANGLGVPTTQVYAAAIAVGCGVRVRQIVVERRRVVRALDHMRMAPPTIAEPPEREG